MRGFRLYWIVQQIHLFVFNPLQSYLQSTLDSAGDMLIPNIEYRFQTKAICMFVCFKCHGRLLACNSDNHVLIRLVDLMVLYYTTQVVN